MWPARALPPMLRALGGVPRLVLRFWEHYEVGHAFQNITFRLHQQPCIALFTCRASCCASEGTPRCAEPFELRLVALMAAHNLSDHSSTSLSSVQRLPLRFQEHYEARCDSGTAPVRLPSLFPWSTGC